MRSKRSEARTDQLTLELEAGLPRLPATLRPMLARPAQLPFDSAAHLFEPSWGGRRALAFVEPAVSEDGAGGWLTADGRPSVRLVDGRGVDLLPALPELRALSLRLEARSAVVDGEALAVDRAGRLDAPRLKARLAGRHEGAIAFLAFDLLYLDGRPLLARPLSARRELLAQVVRPGPEVVIVPAIEGDGIALHAAVVAQRLDGIRARVAMSPYLPGIRSRLWRSIRARGSLGPADVADGTERAEPIEGEVASASGAPVAPLLAVIRRLPLEDAADADEGRGS